MTNNEAAEKEASIKPIKPISKHNPLRAYLFVLAHPKTWKSTTSFIGTAVKDFFYLQFQRKFGFIKTKIIPVDSPLDDYIPFKPEKIDIYLNCINFWIRPLALLVKHRRNHAAKHISDFLELISRCYKEAAAFYRFRMSTTKRPKGIAKLKFIWVKLFDPHYLCVPSLNVSVAVLAATYFKRAFKEEQFSDEEQKFYNAEIYTEAIEIAEAALYTKQLSVNCIAAALYMMSCIFENEFSIQEAVDFINSIFANTQDITPEAKKQINEHLNTLFEQLLLENTSEYDWGTPLKRWILLCEKDGTMPDSDEEKASGCL